MAIHNKPDESVFASSARQGEVSNFPDIGRGWGVSFDQTGGIPPMEWFNFLFKRTDEKFGYLFQRGLSEWSATQEYPIGALVQYKNLTYKAKRENTNKNPEQANSLDWQRWGFTQSELKNATLTESGIVQLLTSTNSDDETKSATPKSVKEAYDKGVEAKTAADNANNNANGRVSKNGDEIKWLNVIRDHAWIGIKSTRYGSAGLDFSVQGSNYPQVSLEAFDVGGFGEELRIHTTPQGSNYDSDRRSHVMTVAHDGNIWVKPYGWLHDYFAKQADINNVWNELNNTYRKNRFGHRYYPNHYNGAEVYDIPMEDRVVLRITVMQATIDNSQTISLPEGYTGFTRVVATDIGGGRHVVGARVENWNSLVIENSGRTGLNIIVMGAYGW